MKAFLRLMPFIFLFLASTSSFAATLPVSVIAPTKYSNCVETMPSEFAAFQTPSCKRKSLKGKACLLLEEKNFEEKLSHSDPSQFASYMKSKKINDCGNSQACIRYTNGVFKYPRKAFLHRTSQLSAFLKLTATHYGIPAYAIVCAMAGDASTTYASFPDQNLYENPMIQAQVLEGVKKDLDAFGLKFPNPPESTIPTAQEIESIRATALILRHAKEIYQKSGFGDDVLTPEILASIYHLGAYRGNPQKNWAEKIKLEGDIPHMSFIGLFCARHRKLLLDTIGN